MWLLCNKVYQKQERKSLYNIQKNKKFLWKKYKKRTLRKNLSAERPVSQLPTGYKN
jgi:hypothetical protein